MNRKPTTAATRTARKPCLTGSENFVMSRAFATLPAILKSSRSFRAKTKETPPKVACSGTRLLKNAQMSPRHSARRLTGWKHRARHKSPPRCRKRKNFPSSSPITAMPGRVMPAKAMGIKVTPVRAMVEKVMLAREKTDREMAARATMAREKMGKQTTDKEKATLPRAQKAKAETGKATAARGREKEKKDQKAEGRQAMHQAMANKAANAAWSRAPGADPDRPATAAATPRPIISVGGPHLTTIGSITSPAN